MAGIYAFMLSTIQKIRREHWGNPVSLEDLQQGRTVDPGLQSFVDELSWALADQGATKFAGTWDIVSPQNAPAITIHQGDNVDGGITIVNNFDEQVSINFETVNNITEIIDVATSGLTGSVDVVTDVSGSGVVNVSGCTGTVTITLTLTKTRLNFSSGLCGSAS